MKHNIKRRSAFTIVELVIVIAIIAILAGVLIPTFSSMIIASKRSADAQLAKNINTALSVAEVTNGRNATFHDAIADIEESGYTLEKLTPTAEGCLLVWDQKNDRIVFLDSSLNILYAEKTDFDSNNDLWVVAKTAEDFTAYADYNLYLAGTDAFSGELSTSRGIDVGNNTGITTINYVNNAEGATAQNVIIRTNGGTLTINAPADTVRHYGFSTLITLEAIGENTHIENGTVSQMLVKEAAKHVVIKKDAFVGVLKNEATTNSANSIEVQGVVQVADSPVNMTVTGYVQNTATVEVTKTETGTVTQIVVKDGTLTEGQGTPANVETRISTVDELIKFRDNVNAGRTYKGLTVTLTADLDISKFGWTPIGVNPSTPFMGTFDGGNHTIKGLNNHGFSDGKVFTTDSTKTTGTAFGLFAYVASDYSETSIADPTTLTGLVTIKNLNLVDVNIDMRSGNTMNSKEGSCVGGIVGYIPKYGKFSDYKYYTALTIDNCTVSGSIKALNDVGGIVGKCYSEGKLTISNCTNNATIEAESTADTKAGGIIGWICYAPKYCFINCTNNGSVTVDAGEKKAHAGGLWGGFTRTFDFGVTESGTHFYIENFTNSGNIKATTTGNVEWTAGEIAGLISGNENTVFFDKLTANLSGSSIDNPDNAYVDVDGKVWPGQVYDFSVSNHILFVYKDHVNAKNVHSIASGITESNKSFTLDFTVNDTDYTYTRTPVTSTSHSHAFAEKTN